MDDLVKEQIIQLLSLNHHEYAKFKTISDEIYLHTFDIEKHVESLYKCRIEQSGKLDKTVDKLNLDFTQPRRFAYIGTGKLALLKNEVKIDKKILDISKYFVNIALIYKIKDFHIFEKPKGEDFSFWKSESENPYIKRLAQYRKSKEYKIQEAVLDYNIVQKEINLEQDWFQFRFELSNFYKNLENLIESEFYLTKYLEKDANKELKDFLENAKKDKNMPHYSKSQIERIIIELKGKHAD